MQIQLPNDWNQLLKPIIDKPYFQNIIHFLASEANKGKTIFPQQDQIFNAFNLTSVENLKVVILGQDPYHGDGQANGLAFSVNKNIALPPSLRNIFKEYQQDLGLPIPIYGDLTEWAKQGILLLNASLTVEKAKANSHSKIGWQQFTDEVIQLISNKKDKVIFVLWGNFAQQKEKLIDTTKHHIIKSAHPSPLSAHNGFWDSKPFSKINNQLIADHKTPINWSKL